MCPLSIGLDRASYFNYFKPKLKLDTKFQFNSVLIFNFSLEPSIKSSFRPICWKTISIRLSMMPNVVSLSFGLN